MASPTQVVWIERGCQREGHVPSSVWTRVTFFAVRAERTLCGIFADTPGRGVFVGRPANAASRYAGRRRAGPPCRPARATRRFCAIHHLGRGAAAPQPRAEATTVRTPAALASAGAGRRRTRCMCWRAAAARRTCTKPVVSGPGAGAVRRHRDRARHHPRGTVRAPPLHALQFEPDVQACTRSYSRTGRAFLARHNRQRVAEA